MIPAPWLGSAFLGVGITLIVTKITKEQMRWIAALPVIALM
jgi:hypothetical protein